MVLHPDTESAGAVYRRLWELVDVAVKLMITAAALLVPSYLAYRVARVLLLR